MGVYCAAWCRWHHRENVDRLSNLLKIDSQTHSCSHKYHSTNMTFTAKRRKMRLLKYSFLQSLQRQNERIFSFSTYRFSTLMTEFLHFPPQESLRRLTVELFQRYAVRFLNKSFLFEREVFALFTGPAVFHCLSLSHTRLHSNLQSHSWLSLLWLVDHLIAFACPASS